MKIATLGPEGTFSHEAVLKFNSSSDIVFKNTIWDIFNSVKKQEADKGIIPIENSLSGSVGLTFDALMEFDLLISGEIILPVKHNLAANGKISRIKKIFINPEAFAQCEKFVRDKLNNVEVLSVTSNAKAAEELSKTVDSGYGAIVPDIAMKKYKLKCISRDIQDSRFNVTRFIIVGKYPAKRTESDRTSIAIYPHMDKPGLLYSLIGEFANRKVNLTKIESRPSKGRLGDYIFFIDLQGSREDKEVKEAFKSIEKNFFLKVLGSYPREY
jgi:prephenate dehydratase